MELIISEAQIVELGGELMQLLPQKAIWWPAQNALLLSDLHIGKATHFRKHGLPMPDVAVKKDLALLADMIAATQAKEVFVLGDLFHSTNNPELFELKDFIEQYPAVQFHLVCGNHDKHSLKHIRTLRLQLHDEKLVINNILLCHDESCHVNENHFTISGHLHPALEITGKARQKLVLQCFWIKEHSMVLPSFGSITGNYIIELKTGQKAWVIGGTKLIALNGK